jgi:hypothetical protein
MAFIPLKNFLSIRHFKLIGLIGPRAVGERVIAVQFLKLIRKSKTGEIEQQQALRRCRLNSRYIGHAPLGCKMNFRCALLVNFRSATHM